MIAPNPHTFFADFFDKGYLNSYLYNLSLKMSEGNVCLDLNDSGHGFPSDMQVENLYDRDKILRHPLVGKDGDVQPFIWDNDKLYTQRYFQYESKFVKNIKRLITQENFSKTSAAVLQSKVFIQSLFPQKQNDIDWQFVATLSALLHNFQIITGGPGTGKTTSVAKLLAIVFYQNPDAKVLLAAPTGKAAVRMAESLSSIGDKFLKEKIHIENGIVDKIQQLNPSTIHSMLGYKKDSIYFKHNSDNPLHADVVVIDECSMIDIALFSKLLDAIGSNTKLILLGDKNQLSSVEAGSLFGDLCSVLYCTNTFNKTYIDYFNHFFSTGSLIVDNESHSQIFQHITELKRSHRFDDTAGIGKFSKAVIQNDAAKIESFFDDSDQQVEFIDTLTEVELEKMSLKFAEYIQETDIEQALKKINRIKILCAVKQGSQGVYRINQAVEKILSDKGLLKLNSIFYENRIVMVSKNQPELQLYNGDTGIIRFVDGHLRACFLSAMGAIVHVSPALIQQMETAFAITIHKSQGSEFDDVLIVLPPSELSPIMNRELLYTAVTRAKRKIVIAASKETILQTTSKTVHRISGIIQRLNN